jgi:hypothetical protein
LSGVERERTVIARVHKPSPSASPDTHSAKPNAGSKYLWLTPQVSQSCTKVSFNPPGGGLMHRKPSRNVDRAGVIGSAFR